LIGAAEIILLLEFDPALPVFDVKADVFNPNTTPADGGLMVPDEGVVAATDGDIIGSGSGSFFAIGSIFWLIFLNSKCFSILFLPRPGSIPLSPGNGGQ